MILGGWGSVDVSHLLTHHAMAIIYVWSGVTFALTHCFRLCQMRLGKYPPYIEIHLDSTELLTAGLHDGGDGTVVAWQQNSVNLWLLIHGRLPLRCLMN